MRVLDWEVNELYRHVVQRTEDHVEIKAKMRAKLLGWMKNERMTYFLVGTHHRWQNWMIVSLLYFKKGVEKRT
jgi:hypothetical protein